MPFWDILRNKVLWAVLVSGLSTQVLKAIASMVREGRLNWHRVLEAGGMPSSHSASSVTLATLVGLHQGFGSILFAVTLYIAFVVMYDAAGVRQAVGRQSIILNRIIESRTLKKRTGGEHLKELLGHTKTEVIVGALIGLAWGLIFFFL
jgi:acid phosphatase family membrane protein YuiD